MGLTKHKMMEEEGRGWRDGPERYVCAECADDEFLAEQVKDAAEQTRCDYCDAESSDGAPIAAPVNVLLQLVGETINHYWTDPAEELPYESAEGGFQGHFVHTRELLTDEIGMDWPESLLDEVEASLTNEVWCRRHYFRLDKDDRLRFGWRAFENTTKHQSRYMCLLPPLESDEWVHPDDVPASAMLDAVAECIAETQMVRLLPVGTKLWRVRAHGESETLSTAAELGAPRADQARFANRMSAAGIAVFYGAFDESTAVVETFDPTDAERPVVTVGVFESTRPLRVLDLCAVPALPSYFDLERAWIRDSLAFLHDFVKSVSRRTAKDGREHIEYVPTQIFAEFVRFRMGDKDSGPIQGIIYPSAQVAGGRCCVLFCDQAACMPPAGELWQRKEQWLSMAGPPKSMDHESCLATVAKTKRPVGPR